MGLGIGFLPKFRYDERKADYKSATLAVGGMKITTMKTSHLPKLAFRVLAVLTLAFGCSSLFAATLTYSGNFPADNPNALFDVNFTTSAPADLTVQTSSIAGGGAQLVLWLFDSTGITQIAKDDPPNDVEAMIQIGTPGMPATYFPAGNYQLIVSVFDQHYCAANTVCNGVVYGNTGWSYNGGYFSNDNTSYAFSITTDSGTLTQNSATFDPNPTQAFPVDTPEPSSAGLLLIGSGVLAWRRRRVQAV